MATISSPGIGSGLDVQSIVSQLVAIERAPITQLQSQATTLQTRLSLYGTIKSQIASLGDAAARLSTGASWGQVTATSSNATAISASAGTGAVAGSYSIDVQQLARAQSTVSNAMASGASVGSGTLTIELGSWSNGSFTASSTPSVSVDILPGEDSLAEVAARINAAGAGVSASVLRDASGERLMIQSRTTGESSGFRITANDDDGNDSDAGGLSRLAYNETATGGLNLAQSALNAQLSVNGVAITSETNRLTDTLPGLNLQLSQVTAQPVEINVSTDTESIRADIQAFVDAYNTVNSTLSNALKYNEATQKGGLLQGDSTATGLQNALRNMMRSVTASTPFSRLVDVGIELQRGGALSIDTARLDTALGDLEGIEDLFSVSTGQTLTQGFGLKIKAFADGLLDSGGSLSNRSEALQSAIDRNSRDQERLEERVSRSETRLLAQYTALDTKLAGLNSLSSFVSQQVTLWNNSSNS
ncbi:MAG: flagellar filament capping protein FliD [Burkholderiaceae bacterium]